VSFYNEETAEAFEEFRSEHDPKDDRVFQTTKHPVNRKFRKVSEETGMKVTVQMLRGWFASEMSRLGVDGEYIDTYCGWTPTRVFEKHYFDYSPERLKEIYDEIELRVLD